MTTQTRAEGRIRIEVEDGVAVFTICRPEVRNALDLECIEGLHVFVRELWLRPDIVAVVFAGEGDRCFVSGGDLKQLALLKGAQAGRTLSRRMGRILMDLESLPQITIAALGGHTYGGGVELALACDMRIIERSSHIALVQSRFGLSTAWGGGVRLVRMLGYARALEVMIEARPIEASDALELGMVNRVVKDGEALTESLAMARRTALLTRPVALGIKTVLRSAESLNIDDAMAEERRVFANLWGSPHHEERVQAFLDRRKKAKG